LDPQFAACAMQIIGTMGIVFGALEIRQDFIPGPPAVAKRCPVVVIALLTAHVDHGVDRGAAAESETTRVIETAAVQALVGLRPVAPVGARIIDGVEIAYGHVDPEIVIFATGFQQQHADVRICAQPVRKQAAGGSGADNDVIEWSHRLGQLDLRNIAMPADYARTVALASRESWL